MGKPRAGGVEGRPPGRCFARKMVSVQQQLAKLSGSGSGSCLQPSPAVEGGRLVCRKQPERAFHKDLLFGCSDYISVLAIERDLAFGFCFQLYLFLPVLNSLCEYQYSESPRTILPSLEIPSSSPSTACRLLPAPASPYALCCTYLALSIPSLLNPCSSGSWVSSTIIIYIVPLVLCTTCFLHLTCSVLSLLLLKHLFKRLRYGMRLQFILVLQQLCLELIKWNG